MGLIKNYDEINSLKNSGNKGVLSAKKCVNNKFEDFDSMRNSLSANNSPEVRRELQFIFDSQECINLVEIVRHEDYGFISESLMF